MSIKNNKTLSQLIARHNPSTSYGTTIVMVDRDRRQIDIFKTANINGCHCTAVRCSAFRIRADTAVRAKALLDFVLIELIEAGIILRRSEERRLGKEWVSRCRSG